MSEAARARSRQVRARSFDYEPNATSPVPTVAILSALGGEIAESAEHNNNNNNGALSLVSTWTEDGGGLRARDPPAARDGHTLTAVTWQVGGGIATDGTAVAEDGAGAEGDGSMRRLLILFGGEADAMATVALGERYRVSKLMRDEFELRRHNNTARPNSRARHNPSGSSAQA